MVHATTQSWMLRNVSKIMRHVLLAAPTHPMSSCQVVERSVGGEGDCVGNLEIRLRQR